MVEIECPLGVLIAAVPKDVEPAEGAEVTLLIDEKGIEMRDSPSGEISDVNQFHGVVTERVFLGAEYELRVRAGQADLYYRVSPETLAGKVEPGEDVAFAIDPEAIRFLGGGAVAS